MQHKFILRKRFQGLGHKKKPNPKIPFKFVEQNEIPPNNKSTLLVWEEDWGYEVMESFLAHQHITDDLKTFGFSRIKAWIFLQKHKGDQSETNEQNKTEATSKISKRKRKKLSGKNK